MRNIEPFRPEPLLLKTVVRGEEPHTFRGGPITAVSYTHLDVYKRQIITIQLVRAVKTEVRPCGGNQKMFVYSRISTINPSDSNISINLIIAAILF